MNKSLIKEKKIKKYLTISEAAKAVGLVGKNGKPQTHTIRFWEKNFKQLRPVLINGYRRYYTLKEINLLIFIKKLLKDNGMTIQGVKNLIKNKSISLDGTSPHAINKSFVKDELLSRSKKILKNINNLKKNG